MTGRFTIPQILLAAVIGWAGSARTAAAPAPAPAFEPGDSVAVHLFRFDPRAIDVAVGERVEWRNDDATTHTVTGGTPEHPDGQLDHALEGGGARFATTFAEPGDYPYFCAKHPFMRGVIHVHAKGADR